jgi:hypothetical protein
MVRDTVATRIAGLPRTLHGHPEILPARIAQDHLKFTCAPALNTFVEITGLFEPAEESGDLFPVHVDDISVKFPTYNIAQPPKGPSSQLSTIKADSKRWSKNTAELRKAVAKKMIAEGRYCY